MSQQEWQKIEPEEEESYVVEAAPIITSKRDSDSPLESYREFETALDRVYARLTLVEALSVRSSQLAFPIILGAGWLSASAGISIKQLFSELMISSAFAQQAEKTAFTPPLGLPQPLFTAIVVAVAVVALGVVIGLVYAGYFASRKSTKAATIVEHFLTFVLGVLFGSVKGV
jgi:hypothetical protein